MDLDHGHTGCSRGIELLPVRVDKERDTYTGIGKCGTVTGQIIDLRCHVETALGCQLLALLGYEAAIRRPDAHRNRLHFRSCSHLEIHACLQDIRQHFNITVLDMSAVLAQVQRDCIGSRFLAKNRSLNRLRVARSARLSQGGDVIDVYSEFPESH